MPAATQVVAQVGAPVAAPVAAPDDSDAADAVRQVEDYMNREKREADIKLEVAEAVRKADAEEAAFLRQRCIEVTAALTALGELAPAASPPSPPSPSPPPPTTLPPTAYAHPLTFANRQCQGVCCPPPSLPPSPAGGTPPSSDDGMDDPQVRLAHDTAHLAHCTLHTPCN